MSRSLLRGALAAGLFWLGGSITAAEPVEALPAPRPVLVAPAPGGVYPRGSQYEGWQNYGVDRYGRFRPLVINSPSGAYYRYNGAPFPWTTTRSMEFMPYLVD